MTTAKNMCLQGKYLIQDDSINDKTMREHNIDQNPAFDIWMD
jgi:hypothetical protein